MNSFSQISHLKEIWFCLLDLFESSMVDELPRQGKKIRQIDLYADQSSCNPQNDESPLNCKYCLYFFQPFSGEIDVYNESVILKSFFEED